MHYKGFAFLFVKLSIAYLNFTQQSSENQQWAHWNISDSVRLCKYSAS